MQRTMEIRADRDFGLAIAEARARLGISQADAAESVAIHRSYLSRLENGLTNILVTRMVRLLRQMGCRIIVQLPEASDASTARWD